MKCPYDADEIIKLVRDDLHDVPDFLDQFEIEESAEWVVDVISPSATGIYQGNDLVRAFDIDLKDTLEPDDAEAAGYENLNAYIEAIYAGEEPLDAETTSFLIDEATELCYKRLTSKLWAADIPGNFYIDSVPDWGDLALLYTASRDELEEYFGESIEKRLAKLTGEETTNPLTIPEEEILAVLSEDEPMEIEEVSGATGQPFRNVASHLMVLEIRRLVKQLPGRRFVKEKQ